MNRGKMEMKAMRDFLRKQNKQIQKDPFCRDVAPYLSARIVSWSRHGILICVHDSRAPLTNYNSFGCRWYFCSGCNLYEKRKIVELLNAVCQTMHKYNKN